MLMRSCILLEEGAGHVNENESGRMNEGVSPMVG